MDTNIQTSPVKKQENVIAGVVGAFLFALAGGVEVFSVGNSCVVAFVEDFFRMVVVEDLFRSVVDGLSVDVDGSLDAGDISHG